MGWGGERSGTGAIGSNSGGQMCGSSSKQHPDTGYVVQHLRSSPWIWRVPACCTSADCALPGHSFVYPAMAGSATAAAE
jgi:hypothetical protein